MKAQSLPSRWVQLLGMLYPSPHLWIQVEAGTLPEIIPSSAPSDAWPASLVSYAVSPGSTSSIMQIFISRPASGELCSPQNGLHRFLPSPSMHTVPYIKGKILISLSWIRAGLSDLLTSGMQQNDVKTAKARLLEAQQLPFGSCALSQTPVSSWENPSNREKTWWVLSSTAPADLRDHSRHVLPARWVRHGHPSCWDNSNCHLTITTWQTPSESYLGESN